MAALLRQRDILERPGNLRGVERHERQVSGVFSLSPCPRRAIETKARAVVFAAALFGITMFVSPALPATLQAQFSIGITIVAAPCTGNKLACGGGSPSVVAPAATAPNAVSYSRQANGVLVWTRTY
jgi:hypothetical protein